MRKPGKGSGQKSLGRINQPPWPTLSPNFHVDVWVFGLDNFVKPMPQLKTNVHSHLEINLRSQRSLKVWTFFYHWRSCFFLNSLQTHMLPTEYKTWLRCHSRVHLSHLYLRLKRRQVANILISSKAGMQCIYLNSLWKMMRSRIGKVFWWFWDCLHKFD